MAKGDAFPAAPDAVLTKYDGLLLDLDGVLYTGPHDVPYAVECVTRALAAGIKVGYVTNNAARSPQVVAAQIASFGLACKAEQVITSAQIAADWLRNNHPDCRRLLVVGGPGLHEVMRESGFAVSTKFDDREQIVVQGFGPDVTWHDLAQASYALAAGCLWVATNLDLTVPTADGIALGNGSLVAALTAATGRQPDASTGKPEATAFQVAAARAGSARPLVVGDRLDTDIAGAIAAGLDSMLVLTGVADAHDLFSADLSSRPTHVATDLRGLFEAATPLSARKDVELRGWSCHQTLANGAVTIHLEGHGHWLDGVRAVAMSCWWALDAGQPTLHVTALDHALAIGSGRADF